MSLLVPKAQRLQQQQDALYKHQRRRGWRAGSVTEKKREKVKGRYGDLIAEPGVAEAASKRCPETGVTLNEPELLVATL